MLSKIRGDGRQLVYCDSDFDPVFLDIGDEESVSLFGDIFHTAAISDKGEVINPVAVINSPNSRIAAVSLPNGEKASSIACLHDSVFVLSSNGRVFSSSIESVQREEESSDKSFRMNSFSLKISCGLHIIYLYEEFSKSYHQLYSHKYYSKCLLMFRQIL